MGDDELNLSMRTIFGTDDFVIHDDNVLVLTCGSGPTPARCFGEWNHGLIGVILLEGQLGLEGLRDSVHASPHVCTDVRSVPDAVPGVAQRAHCLECNEPLRLNDRLIYCGGPVCVAHVQPSLRLRPCSNTRERAPHVQTEA